MSFRFQKVAKLESGFIASGNNNRHIFKPFSIPIPGESGQSLQAVHVSRKDRFVGFRENEKRTKTKIVLHYTVGNIQSDLNTLTPPAPAGYPSTKNRLSVPYIIARDGTIYQLYHSGTWSYHLGKDALGGNGTGSKASIGIELSNYGPLKLSPDRQSLETIYSRAKRKNGTRNPVDIYCSLQDKDQYVELDQPYRNWQYFATFTEAQYTSTIMLLRYLTRAHNIPRKFLPKDQRFVASLANAQFAGINSHVNYRKTGKTDIGPAFDWDKVIAGVTAPAFNAGMVAGNAAAAVAAAAAGIGGFGALVGGQAATAANAATFANEDAVFKAYEAKTRSLGNVTVTSEAIEEASDFEYDSDLDPSVYEGPQD